MPRLPLAPASSRIAASRRIDRHAIAERIIAERLPASETALIPFPRPAPPRRRGSGVLSCLMAETAAVMMLVGDAIPNLPAVIVSWLITEFFRGCAAYAEAIYPICPLEHAPVDRGLPVPPAAPPLPAPPSRARPSLKLVSAAHSRDGDRAAQVVPRGADRPARSVKRSDGWTASIRAAAFDLLAKLRTAGAERQALNELANTDDRTLRDIGICRCEIEAVVRRKGRAE